MLSRHIKIISGSSRKGLKRIVSKCAAGLVAGALVLSLGGCSMLAGKSTPSLTVGQRIPYARFTLLNGQPVTLGDLRGKPVVVIFWASTCTHSPKTVERLNRIVAKIGKDKASFIAASLDKNDAIAEIKEMIRLRDMDNLTHTISGNAEYDEAYLALKGKELPYVLLIATDGTLVYSGGSLGAVEKYFEK